MIRGRLNVFLYFHTMYLQNCTLHIPTVLPHHVPAEEQRSYSFTLHGLPYTYWGGIWDPLTFNVAILSTINFDSEGEH